MKTINFFKTALLTIALFVCGNVGGAETVVDFTEKSASHQNYTETWEYGGWIIYGAANNNASWEYVRVGGKSTASTKTSYFSSPLVSQEISSLKIDALNTSSGSGFTMDKIELTVASDADFSNQIDGVSISNGSISTSMTLMPSDGDSWPANSYYKIEFHWSSTTTSNRGMDIQKVELVAANVSSVATPVFSIPSGRYTEAQNVAISCETEGASIYYTIDESEPTAASTPYSEAINISSTTTLKAVAVKDGESSAVITATYTILTVTPTTIADFLAAEESEDVYYELTGTISNIANTTYGNFDLTDATGTVYVYGLTSTFQTSNDKSFTSLGLVDGDKITICGTRSSYNTEAQVGGPAYFVSKEELPALPTPTAIGATEITSSGFTANWNAVENATSYAVNVWTESAFGVANSGFENGLDNWPANTEWEISTTQAHSGNQSLAFTTTDTRNLTQTIHGVTPGETITVTYWYYLDETTSAGNGIRLWSSWEGSSDKTLQENTFSNTKGEWTEVTKSATVPAGATALNLEIRIYKEAAGYLDDITVTQTNAATTVQTPIAGSPFTATETTSKEITGLTAETTYYYNVVAKAEGYTASEASNTISVTTTAEVAEPTITITGDDLVETEGMYSVALGETMFSTKTSKTFTLTATGITESIKIKPEIMSGYFTIISSNSEQAEVVEELSMFGTSKILTFTPDENGEINAVCTISNRTDSEFADYGISNGEEMLQMFELTFGTPLTEQWGILYQNETTDIRKIITVSLTPTEESTGTGLCNQPVMEGISFNGEEIINSLNLDVVVYNAVGQMVVRSNENINMSSYPAGVYVIKAANGASMKIVK